LEALGDGIAEAAEKSRRNRLPVKGARPGGWEKKPRRGVLPNREVAGEEVRGSQQQDFQKGTTERLWGNPPMLVPHPHEGGKK